MPSLLVLNAGSSSLKFAVYPARDGESPLMSGAVSRIGTREAEWVFRRRDAGAAKPERGRLGAVDQRGALERILEHAVAGDHAGDIAAIGHRVVHGGPHFSAPVRIDPSVVAKLKKMCPYDPSHQPVALAHIEGLAARWPDTPQVACFDTAFHAGLPAVARTLPVPRELAAQGVRRYGFHGLSYAYLLGELRRLDPGPRGAAGRVVCAHLGNGASLAAVRAGACIDTTMSFTPNSGLPMSTRSAELDPGVGWWLAREHGLAPQQIFDLANRHSGLLGVAQTSGDLRELLAREATDPRAAEAVELFCYHVKKAIAAMAAALGGIDTLVFSGGVGEHAAPVRARSCAGLEFLGLEIDLDANATHAAVISRSNARVSIRVIPTQEELVIARETRRVLGL